jgi:hypothetical protein
LGSGVANSVCRVGPQSPVPMSQRPACGRDCASAARRRSAAILTRFGVGVGVGHSKNLDPDRVFIGEHPVTASTIATIIRSPPGSSRRNAAGDGTGTLRRLMARRCAVTAGPSFMALDEAGARPGRG